MSSLGIKEAEIGNWLRKSLAEELEISEEKLLVKRFSKPSPKRRKVQEKTPSNYISTQTIKGPAEKTLALPLTIESWGRASTSN